MFKIIKYMYVLLKNVNTYFIVRATRIIISPTRNIAIITPHIMYIVSFGASKNIQ